MTTRGGELAWEGAENNTMQSEFFQQLKRFCAQVKQRRSLMANCAPLDTSLFPRSIWIRKSTPLQES